jgi:peptide/nickel transport system permease protein
MLHQSISSDNAIAEMRRNLGLDRPLTEQYLFWMIGNDYLRVDSDGDGQPDSFGTRYGLLRGDFGRSIFKRVPVIDLIASKFPATLKLTLAAMALAVPVGMMAGIVAAVKRETVYDYVTMIGALMGVSLPSFWLGLMLMFIFGVQLGWVRPFIGDSGPITLIPGGHALDADHRHHRAAHALQYARRAQRETHARTARQRLRERYVLVVHALRNAMIPVVTVLGLQMGYLLGGAVIVETVFAYPGLGREVVSGILNRDFPVVQGITLFSASAFVLITLIIDVLYTLIDPRIGYGS